MKINNKEIKVSIIIPVYNAAAYVEECIQSVLNQDYEDMEVIIVDDCGEDDSMELVKKTISGTARTVYILEHSNNRGSSAARNTGIMQATGEYIYFLDSDDWIEPYCISSLVKVAQTYPTVDMVIGSTRIVPERELTVDMRELKDYYDDRKQIKKLMLNPGHYPYGIWNRLIKRKLLLSHRLFFKEGIIYEDDNWTFYAAKYVRNLAIFKKTTHYYRRNNSGIMLSMNAEERVKNIGVIVKDWICHIDIHSLFAQLHIIRIYGFYFLHLLQGCYVQKYGGGNRPIFIRMFYPLIYLPMLVFNKNKLFR